MSVGWAYALLAAVALQRLVELLHSRHNTARLIARGGREVGGDHYGLFIALHTAWLVTMALFVHATPSVPVALLCLYAVLQLARLWVIGSLGPYWTTRIVTIEGEPLRQRGPYRFIRHPNYLVVAIEIPLLPLILDQPLVAIIFGLLNLALLAYRIRIENRVLSPRRAIG